MNEAVNLAPQRRRSSRSWFDIRGGQRTDKTPDLIDPENFQEIFNLRMHRGDLRVRNGIKTLSTEVLSGLGLYKSGIETCFIGTEKTGDIADSAAPAVPTVAVIADPTKFSLTGALLPSPQYKITFFTAIGETTASPETAAVSLAYGNVTDPTSAQLTIPTGAAEVVGRRVYANDVFGGVYRLVATINDNTTTTWVDPRNRDTYVGAGGYGSLTEPVADITYPVEPFENTSGGETSNLVKVDPVTGTKSIIATSAGAAQDVDNLHGYGYIATGITELYHYTIQDAGGSPANGSFTFTGTVERVESMNSRIVVVERLPRQDIVRASKLTTGTELVDSNFIPTGDDLDRAVTLSSQINRVDAMKAEGNYIFLFGDGDAEVHVIPDPNEGGRVTLPANYKTMARRFRDVGKVSEDAVQIVDEKCFFMTDGKSLQWISPNATKVQHIYANRGQMEGLDWSKAALGYSPIHEELYISGSSTSINDITIVYDFETGQFTPDSGYYPQRWINDEKNTYFLDHTGILKQAFDTSFIDDDGQSMAFVVDTRLEHSGDDHYLKKAEMVDLEFDAEFPTDVKLEFTADKPFGYSGPSDFSADLSIFKTNLIEQDIRIAVSYKRAAMRLSGAAKAGFLIKKIGWSFKNTSKLYKRS